MKNYLCILLVLLLGCAALRGACSLRAPGVPVNTQSANSCPFKKEVTLPGCYKFSFTGCQGKGTAVTSSGSGSGNNNQDDDDDDDDDDDGGGSYGGGGGGGGGSLTCKATVTDDKPTPNKASCQVSWTNVTEFNKSPVKKTTIPSACVFRAGNTPMKIKLTWQCDNSASKPDGVFDILAEYQKDPPPPTGSLQFAVGSWLLEEAGSQPNGVATIVRE